MEKTKDLILEDFNLGNFLKTEEERKALKKRTPLGGEVFKAGLYSMSTIVAVWELKNKDKTREDLVSDLAKIISIVAKPKSTDCNFCGDSFENCNCGFYDDEEEEEEEEPQSYVVLQRESYNCELDYDKPTFKKTLIITHDWLMGAEEGETNKINTTYNRWSNMCPVQQEDTYIGITIKKKYNNSAYIILEETKKITYSDWDHCNKDCTEEYITRYRYNWKTKELKRIGE